MLRLNTAAANMNLSQSLVTPFIPFSCCARSLSTDRAPHHKTQILNPGKTLLKAFRLSQTILFVGAYWIKQLRRVDADTYPVPGGNEIPVKTFVKLFQSLAGFESDSLKSVRLVLERSQGA